MSVDIIHLSDMHFGAEAPELVRPLLDEIAGLDPELVVVTGDLTQRGKREEFDAAAQFFSRLDRDVVICPGNHDTPLFNLAARVTRPFRRFEKRLLSKLETLQKSENFWLRTFNTARGAQLRFDWSLGVASDRDVAAVIRDLSDAPANLARVVACHHPLVTPPNAPFPARTRGGQEGVTRFVDASVDVVLTGHTHRAFVEPFAAGDQRTFAIGAGTALSVRTRDEPVGFNTLTFGDGEAQVVHHQHTHRFQPVRETVISLRTRPREAGH